MGFMNWHFIGPSLGRPLIDSDFSFYTNSLREMRKGAVRWLNQGQMQHWDFWCDRITTNPEDILLGLATVDTKRAGGMPDWVAHNSVPPSFSSHLDIYGHPNSYILHPGPPYDTFPTEKSVLTPYFDRQLRAARLVFAAVGRYWFERWLQLEEKSVFTEIQNRIVRVNCGCDAEFLPFKHHTTQRELLHVSNLAWCKNPDLLYASMQGVGQRLYVGSLTPGAEKEYARTKEQNTIREVYGIGPFRNSDKEFNDFVLSRCDFYLHTSRFDAQATAILENAARGLVPLITPESGFKSDYAIMLTQEAAINRRLIAQALTMSEAEYRERSKGVRQQIIEYHGWRSIFERITDLIRRDQRGEPVAGDFGPFLS